jgi:tetratricopeptide (TPR) repeat protein
LRSDAHSTDALLGLATLAVRQGRHDQAQAYYLRALEADPANAAAQAGLINGRGYADASASESRLKGALDAQPESSALLFALGNLYARQARWSEAQQAYFRAYAAEPDNADIIFNLAVALDHLRQTKLAAQYYQMALDAARGSGASTLFERDQARARLQELRP